MVQGNSFVFKYSFKGSVDKTVYFKIGDEEPQSVHYAADRSAEGADMYISTEGLDHGVYQLIVWGEATVGTSHITTPSLTYKIPVWKDSSEGTIIVINDAPSEVSEGETINIKYTPYHATETSMAITLSGPEDYKPMDQTFDAIIGQQRV